MVSAAATLAGPVPYRLRDSLEMLWRRRLPLVSAMVALWLLTIALAVGLPARYRSSAVILIEQQEIPPDLVRSTVTSYADQRIQVISQRVMTTSNLMEIIKKFDLYPEDRRIEPLEVVLERMRDDIGMEMVSADVVDPRSGRAVQATIAFTLSYEYESPRLAQTVANELVSLYLNENLKTRTAMAVETSNFLREEAEKLGATLAQLESELAQFKEGNVGRLPELLQVNLELMDRTEREMLEVERQIQMLEERRVYLESELEQVEPQTAVYAQTGERILSSNDRLRELETSYVSLSSRYSDEHPDVIRVKRELAALAEDVDRQATDQLLASRLEAAKADLAAAQKAYTAAHPDVRALSRLVDDLEAALRKARPGIAIQQNHAPNNPAYVQLQARLEAATGELLSLRTREQELRGRLEEFELRLTETPQVERRYRELSREHANALAKYQEVKAKQLEAELSESLEADRKGERFTLIEPPLLPEEPASPNRMAIFLIGTLLSLGGGIGAAAVGENLDNTVRGRRGIEEVLRVRPLSVIPEILTPADEQRRRLKRRAALAAALVLAVAGVLIVHVAFVSLDVLWFSALRRLGL
jgi:uncharacterized protein involved in exopolysaccharide biosynthesis